MINCGENNDNETNCVVRFYIAVKNNTVAAFESERIKHEVLIDATVWCDDKVTRCMKS